MDKNEIPEELQSSAPWLKQAGLGELPLGPCVYFLILYGRIHYIGKAKNVLQRILTHRRSKRLKFDRVFFLPVDARRMVSEEKAWIRRFNPPGNRADVKPHVLARRGRVFTKHRRRRKVNQVTW